MTLKQVTEELKRLSLHDVRSATQQERAEFVTVCHGLVAEIDRENAREVTKLDCRVELAPLPASKAL